MNDMRASLPPADDDVIKALKALSDRMPWPVAKAVLQSVGIHASTGWPTTVEKLDRMDQASQRYKELLEKLERLYREHATAGEKMIKWYSLSGIPKNVAKTFVDGVLSSPTKVQAEPSKFLDSFPYPVRDDATLKELESLGPKLSSIYKRDGKVFFHYCSVRSYRDRIELKPEQFSGADRAMLERFEEIYAVLPVRRQCHDAVVFNPDSNLIEVRVDAPLGMSVEEIVAATESITQLFNYFSAKHFGFSPFGANATSFYSAIDPMYRNASEGRVYELGFMASATGSTSNNQGKLFRGKNRDLRKDAFHVGGSSAVTEITPYRIGVQWHGGLDGTPQLFIPGTMRMLHKSPIAVLEAFVRHCVSESDFSFVTERLHSYVFTKK